MSNDKLFSILDFGSSKLRLGIFKNYLNNSKFISEIDSLDNFEFKSHNEKQKQNLQDLIIKTEKEINQHMNNINVMFDCPKILFIDFSIKKDMDKIKSDNSVFKNILQEAKQIIEEKNKNYKILHIIISKYILDGIEFDNMPENIIIEIPLPIPRSVICSPSQTKNIVPVTSVITPIVKKAKPGSRTRTVEEEF